MKFIVYALGLLMTTSVLADFQWSGVYRFELSYVKSPGLDDATNDKKYVQHHLVLMPTIHASDSLTVYSRFDLFNSATEALSQQGAIWGESNGGCGANCSVVDFDSLPADVLNVTHLYLRYEQDYGAWVFGRAPIHFGLGINHNGGDGLYDHWLDTRDLVAYKALFGLWTITPIYSKIRGRDAVTERKYSLSEKIIKVEYRAEQKNFDLGILVSKKSGSHDKVAAHYFGQDSVATPTRSSVTTYGFYGKKQWTDFSLASEVVYQKGELGFENGGKEVGVGALALAVELDYMLKSSPWQLGANFGYVQGDDLSSEDTYEGFIFDRNYDVAKLLFNYSLGNVDVFHANPVSGRPEKNLENAVDIEAISNVIYLAPGASYDFNERWSAHGTFVAAFLLEDPVVGASGGAGGYELDFGVTFKPLKHFEWQTDVALFSPGNAFEANGNKANFIYGIFSRLAFRF